ncbi:hypothetical protein Dda_9364 [Drechslerella dactyloides]|uniref:Uncharacterized protein n=1 Tax=Drechslerella dactyloides TaxID=74499 RepID=A0AAD6IPF0_DREDA|nr:hypothetical protein Dda_9364 [Drechslerella dactyloides]
MSVASYHEILGSTLQLGVDYQWPGPCQNLGARYSGLTSDFRFFNVCTIYPNLVQGLDRGEFDQSFVNELSSYQIQRITNAPQVSAQITTDSVQFLLNTCNNIKCNNKLSAGNNRSCSAELLNPNNGNTLSLDGTYSCMAAICTNLEPYVKDDPDIGGVGVFISYILQILLVLLMTVYVLFKFILHERRVIPADIHSPFAGSIAFPESLGEFQKLQSWFIGSLVIAAFIRQTQEITNISVTDFLFLGGISLNGVVLICYMNVALLLLGRKSWYVYGLSCVTFVMCSAFIIYANWKRVERVDHVLPTLLFCQRQLAFLQYSDEITSWVRLVSRLPPWVIYMAWGFCAAVQLACFFWMLEFEKKIPHSFKRWIERRSGQIMLWIFIIFIMLCFLAIFGLQLVMLYNFWGIVDPNQWSFGQIIAVTIWLPLIIDYGHGRYKEKRGLLGNNNQEEFPKDEEAGYSVLPFTGAPKTNTTSEVIALQVQPSPPPPHSSSSQVLYSAPQNTNFNAEYQHMQHNQLAPSAYAYPTPQIRIDTRQSAVSPSATAPPTHFASPLLPSMPSSPMFPLNQAQAPQVPTIPGPHGGVHAPSPSGPGGGGGGGGAPAQNFSPASGSTHADRRQSGTSYEGGAF